jgi:hypothetical protein
MDNDKFIKMFKDDNYCKEQLVEARKIFGDINTTREQYEAMEEVVGLIYLYNDNLQCLAEATLHEATIRKVGFEINYWGMGLDIK